MVSKTKTGIKSFDERFGGTYKNRVMFINGAAGTGKTAIALQYINAGLKNDENVLMLSAMPSKDLAILAESMNIEVDSHVESGAFTILEYNDYIPGRDAEENIMLPPETFSQLQAVIEQNGIDRIAIDTIVPWITFSGAGHLAEHIFSFVRAFERLSVTTLFTCPKPASPPAQRMVKYVVDNVPVAINLLVNPDTKELRWKTVKYLGETNIEHSFLYRVVNRQGVVPVSDIDESVPANEATPQEKSGDNTAPAHSAAKTKAKDQAKPSFFSANYEFAGDSQSQSYSESKPDPQKKNQKRAPSASAFSNVVWNTDSPD